MKSFMGKFKTMNFEQLMNVNGGYSSSSGGRSGSSISSSSYSSSSGISVGYYAKAVAAQNAKAGESSTSVPGEGSGGYSSTSSYSALSYSSSCDGTITADKKNKAKVDPTDRMWYGVNWWGQKAFSSLYGSEFGDNACAAVSLLNEISENYSKETGKEMTAEQAAAAMQAAIDCGSIDGKSAYVQSWEGAANAMAKAIGMDGSYSYTQDSTNADIFVVKKTTDVLDSNGNYVYDNNGNKITKDHFVNTIGADSVHYKDPWNGQTGKVWEIPDANSTISYRILAYNSKK